MLARLVVFAVAVSLFLRPQVATLDSAYWEQRAVSGANIYSPSVMLDDDVYKMWYGGWQTPNELKYDKIFYRTSRDNVNWSEPLLVIAPSQLGSNIEHVNDPSVTKVFNTITRGWQYTMFFTVCPFPCDTPQNQIWSATSADGVRWEHPEPLLANLVGSYAPAAIVEELGGQVWKVYYSDMTDCQKIKVASVNGARRVISSQVALDFPGACISDPDVVRIGDSWELYFVRHYVDRTDIFRASSATNVTWVSPLEVIANRGPAYCGSITPAVLPVADGSGAHDLYFSVAARTAAPNCDLSKNTSIQRLHVTA